MTMASPKDDNPWDMGVNYATPEDLIGGLRAALDRERCEVGTTWSLERMITFRAREQLVEIMHTECKQFRALMEPSTDWRTMRLGEGGEKLVADFVAYQVRHLGTRVRSMVMVAMNDLAHKLIPPPSTTSANAQPPSRPLPQPLTVHMDHGGKDQTALMIRVEGVDPARAQEVKEAIDAALTDIDLPF